MAQPLTGLGSAAQTNALLAAASKQTGIAPPSTPFAQAGTLGTIVHEDAQSTTYKNGSNTQTIMKPGFETVDTISPRAQAKLLASHGTSAAAQAAYQQALSGTNISTGAQDVVSQLGALQNNLGQGSADSYQQQYLKDLQASPEEGTVNSQLTALDAQLRGFDKSANQRQLDAEGQPIAQGFISGQQSAMAKQAAIDRQGFTNDQQTLQQKLALLQAKRQSAVDIDKAQLDYAQKQSELNKPFSVSMGASVYNPKTGQMSASNNQQADQLISDAINSGRLDPSQITRYNTASVLAALQDDPQHNFTGNKVAFTQAQANSTQWHQDANGNWFSTQTKPGASGVGSGVGGGSGGGGSSSGSSGGYKAGQLTQLLQTQGKSADDATLKSLWSQYGTGGTYNNDTVHNSVLYKAMGGQVSSSSSGGSGIPGTMTRADAQSLKTQQIYADSTQRAFNTANANLQALIPFMQQAGVNSASTVPIINSLQKAVAGHLTDAGTIAAYQAALAGLRAEYAQVLSRGGEVTEGQRAQAASLIPDNLTPAQLQQVATRLNIEGSNAIKEAQAQVQLIKDRSAGKTTSSSPTSSGGGSNPLGI